MGKLSPRLSYRHTINDLSNRGRSRGQKQLGDHHKVMADKETKAADTDTACECDDDPYRSASCVLVLCEARGAGPGSRLLVRSRLFTPASWAAWCDDGATGTSAAVATAGAAPKAVDMGRPRAPPRWAATAGGEERTGGSGKGGRGRGATAVVPVAGDDVLAALQEEGGPSEVLAEAFEQLLDVEEDEDEDEMLASARGGTGDATRRVLETLARVYDDVRCSAGWGVRLLCSSRYVVMLIRSPTSGLLSRGVFNSCDKERNSGLTASVFGGSTLQC